MTVNKNLLVECEISQYDWNAMMEADGPATNVPLAIRELLGASCPEDAVKAYWKLENHVVVQGSLFEAAVCTVSVICASLVLNPRPKWVMIQLLELLFQLVSGESHSDEVKRGLTDLGEQCRAEASKSLWILYGLFQEGEFSRAAREIIMQLDGSPQRLTTLDELNRQNGRVDSDEPLKI
ncbi:MAG: hypothetical protein ACK5YR_06795 [Pirellula sp.]